MAETAVRTPPVSGTGGALPRVALRLAVLAGLLIAGWLCGCALAHAAAAAEHANGGTGHPAGAAGPSASGTPTGLLGAILAPSTTAAGAPAADPGTPAIVGSGISGDALTMVTHLLPAAAGAVTGTVDTAGAVAAIAPVPADLTGTPPPAPPPQPAPQASPAGTTPATATPATARVPASPARTASPPAAHHRTAAAVRDAALASPRAAADPQPHANGTAGHPAPQRRPAAPHLPPAPSPPAPGPVATAGHAAGGDRAAPAALPHAELVGAPAPRRVATPARTVPTRSAPGLPTITPD